jgi:prolyl oligopeptidase
MSFKYPEPKREEIVDDLHGTQVPDPYRWMEATDDPKDLVDWIDQENEIFHNYVSECPIREKVLKTLVSVYNYEKVDVPYKRGSKYYFYKNDGLLNQYVLYERDTIDSEPVVLIDPNTFSTDGTIALSRTFFSQFDIIY